MHKSRCANWMAGMALVLVASMVHGQDAGKAAGPAESMAPTRSLFIVHLTTGPGWNKDKPAPEQSGFREHSQNLSRLRSEGTLVMGARYKDSVADKGMLIVRGDNIEAVKAQFAADPMVKDKLFVLDIAPFQPFYDGFIARPVTGVASPDSQLNSLGWLAGCWSGRLGKREFREHWMRPAGGVMMGMGHTISEGKTLSHEAMRIELDASGAPVFIAKPSGQPEASFKRESADASGIVFANPAHDFPQRVSYQLKPDGTLHARIEGMRDGKERGADFPMRRASCD